MRAAVLGLMALAGPALADTVVATRTIRAQMVVGPQDLAIIPGHVPGALSTPDLAVGLEARVTLYSGRPIQPGDLRPPAVVARNQIVTLQYRSGGLAIVAEGRALERGADGDVIRVMNLASRSIVSGRVQPDGSVIVGVSD